MFIINFFRNLQVGLLAILRPFQIVARVFKKFRVPSGVKYFLEFLLVIGVVVGLSILNYYLRLDRHLEGPTPLRRVWLGVIAFLVYLAIRLFIFILQQLPGAVQDYPDIDEAMEAGLAALADARIHLQDTPLFLVVGMTHDAEAEFASNPAIGKDVCVNDRRLPIHWYGSDRGIWVTLPGVSALSQQVHYSNIAAPAATAFETGAVPSDDLLATFGPGGKPGPAPLVRPLDRFETGGAGPIGGGGRFATLGSEPPGGGVGGIVAAIEARPPRLAEGAYRVSTQRLTVEQRESARLRMEYFVKLLCEARYPVCTVNGVLLLMPWIWTTSPGESQLAETAKGDMVTLQNGLGVKCLCLTVLTGIEKSPEFTEYVERLDPSQRDRRCGCGFPPLINLDPVDIEKAHTWLVGYFERQVFEIFQRDLGHVGNGKLFRLLDVVRKSKANFARMLTNAFPKEVPEPFYFGGVYFAGIGPVGSVRSPFFDGVLAKMIREHDDVVGWTDRALSDDQRYKNWSGWVTGLVVAVTILNALLVLWMILPQYSPW